MCICVTRQTLSTRTSDFLPNELFCVSQQQSDLPSLLFSCIICPSFNSIESKSCSPPLYKRARGSSPACSARGSATRPPKLLQTPRRPARARPAWARERRASGPEARACARAAAATPRGCARPLACARAHRSARQAAGSQSKEKTVLNHGDSDVCFIERLERAVEI